MRIHSLVALALAGCLSNPDLRDRSQQRVLRDGHGGWVQITHRDHTLVEGELIAVQPAELVVLEAGVVLAREPIANVGRAELFEYQTQHQRLTLWGVLGAVSSASHGFFSVFSLPIWFAATVTSAAFESRAAHLTAPGDAWSEFAKWARFPQGLPPGLSAPDLVRQDRRPPPAPPPLDAGPPPDAGAPPSDAPPDAAAPEAGAGVPPA